jgi:hypothetical protein
MWKEAVVSYFKILPHHLIGGNEVLTVVKIKIVFWVMTPFIVVVGHPVSEKCGPSNSRIEGDMFPRIKYTAS